MIAPDRHPTSISPEIADLLADGAARHRENLFAVISILSACYNALATNHQVTDPEYMGPALRAASNLADSAACELGIMVKALRGDTRELLAGVRRSRPTGEAPRVPEGQGVADP